MFKGLIQSSSTRVKVPVYLMCDVTSAGEQLGRANMVNLCLSMCFVCGCVCACMCVCICVLCICVCICVPLCYVYMCVWCVCFCVWECWANVHRNTTLYIMVRMRRIPGCQRYTDSQLSFKIKTKNWGDTFTWARGLCTVAIVLHCYVKLLCSSERVDTLWGRALKPFNRTNTLFIHSPWSYISHFQLSSFKS